MKPSNEPEDLFASARESASLSGPAFLHLLMAVLDKGASFRFQATGQSMSPFIRDGDLVTVCPVIKTPIRLGDVVAFLHPVNGGLTLHRVVEKRGDFYRTQGDNTTQNDGLVPGDGVLGQVKKVERDGKMRYGGLGPERPFIAFLSRRGLLRPLVHLLWNLKRSFLKRGKG